MLERKSIKCWELSKEVIKMNNQFQINLSISINVNENESEEEIKKIISLLKNKHVSDLNLQVSKIKKPL